MRTEQEIREQLDQAVIARRHYVVWALKWVLGEQEDPAKGEFLPSRPWSETWDPKVRKRLERQQMHEELPLVPLVEPAE